jgi:cupin fold WbuC family metalloprotein
MHAAEHAGARVLAACLQPESYMVPHLHNSNHGEILTYVQGDTCVFIFDNEGQVKETHHLREDGLRIIEIPPKTYHTAMAVTPDSVLFEVSQGPYNAETYKQFAPWAPREENAAEGQIYWNKLRSHIK